MSLQLTAEDVQVARKRLDREAGISNKIFAAQDENVLRSMLVDERRYLYTLDQEIHRVESMLARLRKQRRGCVSRMNRYSAALSPQKHLPPEILAKIFVHSLCNEPTLLPPTATGPPWVLRWVCSRWRQVALRENRLWSHLNLEVEYSSSRFSTGGIIASWIPYLWGKKQTFPVTLTITSYDRDHDIALRDTLLPYSQRLESLSLNISKKSLSLFLITPPIPFDRLNSLALTFHHGIPFGMSYYQFEANPPRAVFTASPQLKKLTLWSTYPELIEPDSLCRFPWSQLTHITFMSVQMPIYDLHYVLRQCTKLVSLTFTPYTNGHSPPLDTSLPEITLPSLQSLTWITGGSRSTSDLFTLLRVPSMNEFSMKSKYDEDHDSQPLQWHQPLFINMLNDSGCILRSLNLSSTLEGIALESLLSALPELVSLVLGHSNPVPGILFEMMIQGEVLQKLQHLECLALSPVSFLHLMEYQYQIMTSGEYQGLTSAKVSYRAPETRKEFSDLQQVYENLRPKLEIGKKDIVFTQVQVAHDVEFDLE